MLLGTIGCSSDGQSSSEFLPPDTPPGLAPANFVDLKDLQVTIGATSVPLAASPLVYLRRGPDDFDDPATPDHEAVSGAIRNFLDCTSDTWSIGSQTFTVDLITRGVVEHDATLVSRGLLGADWGAGLDLSDQGIHSLTRTCEGRTETIDTLGGTHTATQWLESMGRAVWLTRAAGLATEHQPEIDRIIARMEELADLLVADANRDVWEQSWLVDAKGNIFTHKTWMRAAGLSLASSLTVDRDAAAVWTAEAERIARRGLAAQQDDGVNPERGGHDVSYQMYGTWLAELYDSTLPEGELKDEVEAMIDRSLQWFSGRVDAQTGQVDIAASTRTCISLDASTRYEAADAVRVFLTWGAMHTERTDLVDEAVLIDQGARSPGNPCP